MQHSSTLLPWVILASLTDIKKISFTAFSMLMQGLAHGFPLQFPPLLMLYCASSHFNPHTLISIHTLLFQSTHSHVPLHRLTPCCPCSSSPPLALHTFTKSPSSQCNTYPSHFNHFPLTTSDADSTPILPRLRSTHTHPSYHFHFQ